MPRCSLPAPSSSRSVGGRTPKLTAVIMDATIERFGGLDILVVGSGLGDVSPIDDVLPERFEGVARRVICGVAAMSRVGQRAIAPKVAAARSRAFIFAGAGS